MKCGNFPPNQGLSPASICLSNYAPWRSLLPKILLLQSCPFILLDLALLILVGQRRAEESKKMFGLPMEPRPASSAFPLAIRARLSTEDSASDASSFVGGDSDDNSGIEESGEEEDEVTKEDNAALLRRLSMPVARITEDDEDDDALQELLFEDDDDEEEDEGDVNPNLAVVKLVAGSLNAEVDEEFVGGLAFGREESGLFYGNEEKDDSLGDDGPAKVSEDELLVREEEKGNVEEVERMIATIDDTGADEGGLELNDVKEEMDGSKVEDDMGFSAVVCEKIGAVGYGNVNKGFKLELKNLVVESSIRDSEKSNFAGDIDSTQNSVMEVVLRALRGEADHANMVIPEVEGNPIEIVKIEAFGAFTSSQHWNDEAEPKSAEVEFGVWEDMEEVASGAIDPKNYFFGEKTLDTSEAEAHSNEFKGFEAIQAVGFSHSQILEMLSLDGSETSEPKHPEVYAVNMEAEKDKFLYENVNSVDSEKGKDSFGKLLISTGSENVHGSSSPSKDVSAQFLENFNEKNDESRAVIKEVFITENYNSSESYSDNLSSFYAYEKEMESRFDSFHVAHHENPAEEDEHVISEWPARLAISENSESVKHILKEMEDSSSRSHLGFETSRSYSHNLDGQTSSNSDKEGEADEDGSAKELFDTSALAALLRASSGASSGGAAHLTSQDTSSMNDINDEVNALYLKLEQIWAKYMCLVEKLGHSANDALPDHVLYRMGLINRVRCGRKIGEEFRPEIAKKLALKLDEGKDDFSFSCTILVIGKTGVGKSAAINSIFGEERAFTDPFKAATTSVREISGVVDGVHIRFIDTPGLLTSMNDQGANRRILSSIKKYTGRCPPDVVLYVDRLDAYNRDFNELPILRMITNVLGSSIWFNAIIALTHAASASPDGSDGSSLSYEGFVLQRSKVVQQLIRQAAEDTGLANLVALVDSDPSCSRNIDGESILPNGLKWRPWLLLLCYSSKILSELNSLVNLKIPSPKKLFPFHWPYPLPVFLSSLLHSKVQGLDTDDSDIDFDNMTKEVLDDDNEHDQLPPFELLKKSEVQKLTKAHVQLKRLKKMDGEEGGQYEPPVSIAAEFEQEAKPTPVVIPLPDMLLPPSFDDKNPTYLYPFLEPISRLLTRPVLHTHTWDLDYADDEVSVGQSIGIARQFPVSLAVQIMKDKKEFTIHLDSSIESNPLTGKQMAYSLESETKFRNLKKKTATGTLSTCLGENLVNGLKLEEQINLGKKLCLVASNGVVRAQRNIFCGVDFEVCFREKDYPIGQALSAFGLSVKWRDFAVGANFQSEFSTGRNSKTALRVGLNNRCNGQISITTSNTEQVHIALLGLFSLVLSVCRSNWNGQTK
ncbi:hypothetical protein IEQ34_001040 [Dendrobium chrysotoxum]|uniref:AIG1-type G domain-containing protein n=1 Tax=Dendrobium chrysotoxum TaxID=161865 RepID=A0AAV7HKN7_DENCH|nr:hypothetical protein IEQ34_001040 [Dendrobium chrysotoxum]